MHDLIKKKIIYTRPTATTYTAMPVEFPVGLHEVVSLIAIHWAIELLPPLPLPGAALFLAALSENPNHLLNPPAGVAEFQGNQDMYGMVTFLNYITGGNTSMTLALPVIVPLYGMLRPKRQVAVFAHLWGSSLVGIRGEIYYEEESPSPEIVDAISRRYGKYRRT